MLDALTAIGSVPSHLSAALKATPWIQTRSDRAVAPQYIVQSRSMNAVIRDVLDDIHATTPTVVSLLELPDPFLSHKVVPGLFPSGATRSINSAKPWSSTIATGSER